MALARGIDLVLLAHHRRDQAETFLLQALRGGGVAGAVGDAGANPARRRDLGAALARAAARSDRGLRRAGIGSRYVDDDSNADARFARNRLRLEVWPALVAAFPAPRRRSPRPRAGRRKRPPPWPSGPRSTWRRSAHEGVLDIAAWRALSPARQSNLRARLAAALDRSGAAREPGRAAAARGSAARRHALADRRRRAAQLPRPPSARADRPAPAARRRRRPASRRHGPTTIDLSRPGVHDLAGWDGAIEVRAVAAGGIAAPVAARLEVRARRPGDRFQAGAGRPPRSLKLQFQARRPAGVAAPGAGALPATACRSSSPGSASMPAPWRRRGAAAGLGLAAAPIESSVRFSTAAFGLLLRETACSGRQQAPSSWH